MRRLPLTGLRRALLRRADAVVTISQAIETELADFGLSGVPFCRIPNAVDCTEFSPADAGGRATLRARLGLPAAKVLCAFVGRLAPQKVPELLADAWSMSTLPNAHLVLVGDGPLRAPLERRLAPDRERVTFVGATDDVVSYLRAADLLVLPSQAEGMSGVILEAMACGLPIIATDVPGNRELLGADGTVGMLVPPGEASGLAEAMGCLAGSPERRRTLGGNARAMALERFDIQRVATEYLSLYASLGF
jgi:glycosyltransferase involved in cell wall biosynthesis